ncbi:MAG: hypothetical protein R2716_01565 [Microthrixaceae bacterium]
MNGLTEQPDVPRPLLRVLESARARSLLGKVPVAAQISHSLGFAQLLASGSSVVDLGAGGGFRGWCSESCVPTWR